MVGNDTVRGNGLTEILPICRVSKVRTCSNDMSLASVRWFISTRLPFYKMFRPISFALNVTKYFMLRYYQYFLYLLLRVYKLSFSKVNHVIFQIFNFISREKILSDYSSKYDRNKNFLKSSIATLITFRSWFYLYPCKIQLFEMNSGFAVTCRKGERIMHNSHRRKDRGSACLIIGKIRFISSF